MDILWKIVAVLVLLPLILQGVGILLQIALGSGVGLVSLFSSIWDKEKALTFKEGCIVGIVFVVVLCIIDLFLYFVVSFVAGDFVFKFIPALNWFVGWVALIMGIVAMFRSKFKFGVGFIVLYNITCVVLFQIVAAIF